nr:MAG TPA: hypothetical protein [Caudoviricetes sp.]
MFVLFASSVVDFKLEDLKNGFPPPIDGCRLLPVGG